MHRDSISDPGCAGALIWGAAWVVHSSSATGLLECIEAAQVRGVRIRAEVCWLVVRRLLGGPVDVGVLVDELSRDRGDLHSRCMSENKLVERCA